MNYSLQMKDQQLELADQDEPAIAPVCIDFVSGKTSYRRKYGHAGGEAIGKAVGIKKGHRPNIVDPTAGWGGGRICTGDHGMSRAYDRKIGSHCQTS